MFIKDSTLRRITTSLLFACLTGAIALNWDWFPRYVDALITGEGPYRGGTTFVLVCIAFLAGWIRCLTPNKGQEKD